MQQSCRVSTVVDIGKFQSDLTFINANKQIQNEFDGYLSQSCASFFLAMSAKIECIFCIAIHWLICRLWS